ncbi:MAG: GNAT family N-acetyltransferase [Bacteroidota bacterium]
MISDFSSVFEFVCELEETKFDRDTLRRIFEYNISKECHIYLVAVANEEVAGYVSCHGQQLLHHGGWIYEIQEMFVRSEQRSSGIGKLLMHELKRRAREKGALQLEVTANNSRVATHEFYAREKFHFTHKKFVLKLRL